MTDKFDEMSNADIYYFAIDHGMAADPDFNENINSWYPERMRLIGQFRRQKLKPPQEVSGEQYNVDLVLQDYYKTHPNRDTSIEESMWLVSIPGHNNWYSVYATYEGAKYFETMGYEVRPAEDNELQEAGVLLHMPRHRQRDDKEVEVIGKHRPDELADVINIPPDRFNQK